MHYNVYSGAFIHLYLIISHVSGINTENDPLEAMVAEKPAQNEKVLSEPQRLQNKNTLLKEQLAISKFGVDSVRCQEKSDDLIQFYTGIPSFAMFDWLVSLVEGDISPVEGIRLPNKIPLVLMKLRLNLRLKDLVARFRIGLKKPATSLQKCCQ